MLQLVKQEVRAELAGCLLLFAAAEHPPSVLVWQPRRSMQAAWMRKSGGRQRYFADLQWRSSQLIEKVEELQRGHYHVLDVAWGTSWFPWFWFRSLAVVCVSGSTCCLVPLTLVPRVRRKLRR